MIPKIDLLIIIAGKLLAHMWTIYRSYFYYLSFLQFGIRENKTKLTTNWKYLNMEVF